MTDAQRGEGTRAIRHVMFDADGVLQSLPGGWIAAAEPFFGERALREVLGYDALFDVSCYRWELGAAKPDLAFFNEAARRIGAEPAAILFIDDNARNVAAAREAGLRAEQWCLDDGHDVLHGLLARDGVTAL